MLIKRNQGRDFVFGTLVLSSCLIAACAVGIDNTVDPFEEDSGQGSAGFSAAGASDGGSFGSTGTAGKSAGGATGSGGRGGGGKGSGGATGGGGRGSAGRSSGGRGGGSATGGGGKGSGGATGGGGKGSGTAGTGAGTVVNLDLSTFQPVAAGSYNGTTHTLTVVAQPSFQFPLPRALSAGQSVVVHVAGTNNGTVGLRSWLVDGSQTTLSNVVTTYVGAGLSSGSFMLDYTLTATNLAGFLFYKGPSVGTNIDRVSISSITISY